MGFLDKNKEIEVPQHAPKEYVAPVETTKPKRVIQVVPELPTQVVREHKLEDGTIVEFITIEEALTRVMNSDE